MTTEDIEKLKNIARSLGFTVTEGLWSEPQMFTISFPTGGEFNTIVDGTFNKELDLISLTTRMKECLLKDEIDITYKEKTYKLSEADVNVFIRKLYYFKRKEKEYIIRDKLEHISQDFQQ